MRPRNISVSVGIRPGDRTLVAMTPRNQKERDNIRMLLKKLQDEKKLPSDSFAIASTVCHDELLLVVPFCSDPEGVIKEIKARLAMELDLLLQHSVMSPGDYDTLKALSLTPPEPRPEA